MILLPSLRLPGILFLTTLLLAAGGGSAAFGDDRFVSGFDDLPLMQGLDIVEDAGMVFDKPGGRIVEAVARGATSADAVARFYGATLPQLGWTPLSDRAPDALTFRREGEILRIEVSRRGDGLTVRFFLSPS